MAVENFDYEIDQILRANDETFMPLPDLNSEPHLLMSKVRKHYMEYVIKLLSMNYETNQKLLNKNIYLPSAIWRCAKNIEMNAAQACMVVQLYRKNITSVVNELKNDTIKGKLNKKLYECLNKPPINDKKTQTRNIAVENKCQCGMNKRKKRCSTSISPKDKPYPPDDIVKYENFKNYTGIIPATNESTITHSYTPLTQTQSIDSPHPEHRVSIDSDPDELMKQLEKLFQGDPNDDDIFEGTLCDRLDNTLDDAKKVTNILEINKFVHESVIEDHAAQIKSLDERLASLTGILINNDNTASQKNDNQKYKKKVTNPSKWLCEEYYLKIKLYELLDQIGDNNRKSLEKIKMKFLYYFGQDSDDEGIISPLDETPEFVVSCKERIAPWVVKMLTPYYIKGNIKGKSIFKSLAKHLIRLIYQCSRYPEEYEVTSFVADFLKNHKIIRCEADFKEFKIENI